MYNSYAYIYNIIGTFWLLIVAWFVLNIVANWKIFTKAGQPGWASIVPFYKDYIVYKIFWGNGWLFLVPLCLTLLGVIPLLGTFLAIIGFIIFVFTKYKKAEAFGQGIGFTIGLFFLEPIFTMILAFGKYEYLGVPQDGTSYVQLKQKKSDMDAKRGSVTYEAPKADESPTKNVTFVQPNAKSEESKEDKPE